MKTTIQVGLFMSEYTSIQPEDLISGDPAEISRKSIIHSPKNTDSIPQGWTQIGTGELTFALHARDEVQKQMLAALESQLHNHRAKSQQVENQILGRIRDLQSLPVEVQS